MIFSLMKHCKLVLIDHIMYPYFQYEYKYTLYSIKLNELRCFIINKFSFIFFTLNQRIIYILTIKESNTNYNQINLILLWFTAKI